MPKKILFMGTSGPEEVNKATFPFLFAVGCLENGDVPILSLSGNATFLMKASIRDDIKAVGPPPIRELLPRLVEHAVPIYI